MGQLKHIKASLMAGSLLWPLYNDLFTPENETMHATTGQASSGSKKSMERIRSQGRMVLDRVIEMERNKV